MTTPEHHQAPGRDLRHYSRQTQIGAVTGFLVLLFLVGDGLIWAFWGKAPALMGLLCLVLGLMPVVLIGAALLAMEWIVKHVQRE
jgi:hypothetical protein